jgi:hypothetical protein
MKKYFNKPVDIKIYFACGFKAIFEDIIGIGTKDNSFILMCDLGEFEAFYDYYTGEEIMLDFRMEEITKIEIV